MAKKGKNTGKGKGKVEKTEAKKAVPEKISDEKKGDADSTPKFDPATATCDVFGTFDPTSKFCTECSSEEAEMHAACKAATAAAKAIAPKPKGKKGPAKGTGGKNLSVYGHRPNTQAAALDDAFRAGMSIAEIMSNLELSKARVTSHYRHLIREQGLIEHRGPNGRIQILREGEEPTVSKPEDDKKDKKAA